MQDFAPFTPELLGALSGQTPSRTATALRSWSTQVEGPLHAVEGY
jgi:hypothetical protein